MLFRPELRKSACPHDCPSACSLEVTVLPDNRIGRIAGSAENSYTAGVVCAKVARYAERVHHADRLMRPLRRSGSKGEGLFAPISWDEALDEIADRFKAAMGARPAASRHALQPPAYDDLRDARGIGLVRRRRQTHRG
jgi:anaerobic selenocysteine-containing dehydrogenase